MRSGIIYFFVFAATQAIGQKPNVVQRSLPQNSLAFSNLKEAPELVIENGVHNGRVQSIKYTKDNKEIVTASWDKTIRIWDVATGALIRTVRVPAYAGIEGQIYAMDVSHNKQFIAAAGSSVGQRYDVQTANYIGDYVLLIDFKTGKIVDVAADCKQSIFAVAFSPDGKKLALGSGGADNKVNIYSVDAVHSKLKLDESFSMTTVSKNYFPSCDTFLDDVCEHPVAGVQFSPDSKSVYVVDAHGMLLKHTLASNGIPAADFLIGESAGRKSSAITGKLSSKAVFRSLAVDPKGRYVAAGDGSGKIVIVDANGNKTGNNKSESIEILLATISTRPNTVIAAMDFNPAGNKLAVTVEGEIRIYDIPLDLKATPLSNPKPNVTIADHKTDVMSVAFNVSGSQLASSGGETNATIVSDVVTGKKLLQLGNKRVGTKITSVGANKSNPLLIGFGTHVTVDPRVNHWGTISKAFDLATLQIIDSVKAEDFITAETDKETSNADFPQFKSFFDETMISYLKVASGKIIIGTHHNLFVNDAGNLLAITGTQALGMAKSIDASTFYTGHSDGLLRIWDSATMQLVASLYISFDNEWILFSPDGYYTASKNGSKLVGWLINNGVKNSPSFYPFEQFDLRLNRPDIILKRIGGVPEERIALLNKVYLKRLQKMGVSESALNNSLMAPEVSIDLNVAETTQKMLSFKVKANDKESNLDRLQFFVNDVPVYGSLGKSLRDQTSKTLDTQLSTELNPGINKIQISVLNQAGIESNQETRYVTLRSPAPLSNLYVLAIGVSDYTDNNFDLRFASKDANDICTLFEGQVGKFLSVKSKRILDTQATKENISASVDFLKQATVNDVVILFVAGHGLLDANLDFYFATSDIDFANPSVRGFKYEDLEGLLDKTAARKKLMLIDACHSGELDKEGTTISKSATPTSGNSSIKFRGFQKIKSNSIDSENTFELMRQMFADLRKGSGAMVISSASGVEFAFENDTWKNGVFTYSLIEGIKNGNANANKDNQVQVSEWRDYVIKRVNQLTEGKQNPTSRRENLEFDFRVW